MDNISPPNSNVFPQSKSIPNIPDGMIPFYCHVGSEDDPARGVLIALKKKNQSHPKPRHFGFGKQQTQNGITKGKDNVDQARRRIVVRKTTVLIGQEDECDIRIKAVGVSHKHAAIEIDPSPPYNATLSCLGSNPVCVTLSLGTLPEHLKRHQSIPLQSGSIIDICGRRFVWESITIPSPIKGRFGNQAAQNATTTATSQRVGDVGGSGSENAVAQGREVQAIMWTPRIRPSIGGGDENSSAILGTPLKKNSSPSSRGTRSSRRPRESVVRRAIIRTPTKEEKDNEGPLDDDDKISVASSHHDNNDGSVVSSESDDSSHQVKEEEVEALVVADVDVGGIEDDLICMEEEVEGRGQDDSSGSGSSSGEEKEPGDSEASSDEEEDQVQLIGTPKLTERPRFLNSPFTIAKPTNKDSNKPSSSPAPPRRRSVRMTMTIVAPEVKEEWKREREDKLRELEEEMANASAAQAHADASAAAVASALPSPNGHGGGATLSPPRSPTSSITRRVGRLSLPPEDEDEESPVTTSSSSPGSRIPISNKIPSSRQSLPNATSRGSTKADLAKALAQRRASALPKASTFGVRKNQSAVLTNNNIDEEEVKEEEEDDDGFGVEDSSHRENQDFDNGVEGEQAGSGGGGTGRRSILSNSLPGGEPGDPFAANPPPIQSEQDDDDDDSESDESDSDDEVTGMLVKSPSQERYMEVVVNVPNDDDMDVDSVEEEPIPPQQPSFLSPHGSPIPTTPPRSSSSGFFGTTPAKQQTQTPIINSLSSLPRSHSFKRRLSLREKVLIRNGVTATLKREEEQKAGVSPVDGDYEDEDDRMQVDQEEPPPQPSVSPPSPAEIHGVKRVASPVSNSPTRANMVNLNHQASSSSQPDEDIKVVQQKHVTPLPPPLPVNASKKRVMFDDSVKPQDIPLPPDNTPPQEFKPPRSPSPSKRGPLLAASGTPLKAGRSASPAPNKLVAEAMKRRESAAAHSAQSTPTTSLPKPGRAIVPTSALNKQRQDRLQELLRTPPTRLGEHMTAKTAQKVQTENLIQEMKEVKNLRRKSTPINMQFGATLSTPPKEEQAMNVQSQDDSVILSSPASSSRRDPEPESPQTPVSRNTGSSIPTKTPSMVGLKSLLKTPGIPVPTPNPNLRVLQHAPDRIAPTPQFGGIKSLLKTPKPLTVPVSPNLGGVRDLLREPASPARTPSFNGLRDMYKIPVKRDDLDAHLEGAFDTIRSPSPSHPSNADKLADEEAEVAAPTRRGRPARARAPVSTALSRSRSTRTATTSSLHPPEPPASVQGPSDDESKPTITTRGRRGAARAAAEAVNATSKSTKSRAGRGQAKVLEEPVNQDDEDPSDHPHEPVPPPPPEKVVKETKRATREKVVKTEEVREEVKPKRGRPKKVTAMEEATVEESKPFNLASEPQPEEPTPEPVKEEVVAHPSDDLPEEKPRTRRTRQVASQPTTSIRGEPQEVVSGKPPRGRRADVRATNPSPSPTEDPVAVVEEPATEMKEAAPARKGRAPKATTSKKTVEPEVYQDQEEPPKRATRRKAAAVPTEPAVEETENVLAPITEKPAKSTRARTTRKAATKEDSDKENAGPAVDPAPSKAKSTGAVKKGKSAKVVEENIQEDVAPEPVKKKATRATKAAVINVDEPVTTRTGRALRSRG